MAKTTAIAKLSKDKRAIYDGMSKDWQDKAARALEIRNASIHRDLWAAHELGEIVREMAGQQPKYGESAVLKLAELLDEDPNNLWECKAFCALYPKERLEKLLVRAAEAGCVLTMGHVEQLLTLKGANASKVRKEAENLVIEQGFTVRDLRSYLNQIIGKRSSHPGPALKAPKTPQAGITQLNKVATEFERRIPLWEKAVIQHFKKAGADQFTTAQLEELESSVALQTHFVEAAEGLRLELVAARDRVKRVLTARIDSLRDNPRQKALPAGKRQRPDPKSQLSKSSLEAATSSNGAAKKATKPTIKKAAAKKPTKAVKKKTAKKRQLARA